MVSSPIRPMEITSPIKPKIKPCGSVVTILRIPSERITAIPVMTSIEFTNELIMRSAFEPKTNSFSKFLVILSYSFKLPWVVTFFGAVCFYDGRSYDY